MLPVVALLLASALWGLTWLPLKYFGTYGIAGPLVTLAAHGAVGLLALPLLARGYRAWKSDWRSMALLAVSGGLANLAFATAMQRGDVTRVMVLFYLLPAWGVLLAYLVLGERVDARRRLSLLAGLAGGFLAVGGPRVVSEPPTWIDGLAALSGFALAVNNVVFRKTQSVAIAYKVGAVFAGSLAWAAAVVLLGRHAAPVTAPPLVWLEVVGFGLFWILLATVGTLYGVNHLEAGRSSLLIITELVTAVVSSAAILRQLPSRSAMAGGVLILASALLEAVRPPLEIAETLPKSGA